MRKNLKVEVMRMKKQMQDGKDFNITQKQFNEERTRLLWVMSIAERFQQKNETGERNSFW